MKRNLNRIFKINRLGLVILLIVALTTTIVIAQTTNTYSACLSKGAIYNVAINANPPVTCKQGDQLITWNQQGIQGPKGDTGSQGPKGDTGATGLQGQPGISGYEQVNQSFDVTTEATQAYGRYGHRDISCPSGKKILGGGSRMDTYDNPLDWVILSGYPVDSDTWRGSFSFPTLEGGGPIYQATLTLYVICANVE